MELTWRLQPTAHTALPQAAADRVPAWCRRELPLARSRQRTAASRAPHSHCSRATRTAASPSPRRHLGCAPRRTLPAWLPGTSAEPLRRAAILDRTGGEHDFDMWRILLGNSLHSHTSTSPCYLPTVRSPSNDRLAFHLHHTHPHHVPRQQQHAYAAHRGSGSSTFKGMCLCH
uniref:Uncharacterized protein n=1 Tax=Oryza meridionalis TaxID=40149 RepID=A0A0E0ES00_9ORYZ